MKKQYVRPESETVRLKLADRVLDDLFGNASRVPVNAVNGDDGSSDGVVVDEMYGKSSSGSSLWDD